ncbi:MAG: hypothetical protein EBV05_09070 [Cyanobacteria bacterium WB6_1B_304]|nr:hypothetical protein [Cyanobacteria bacterium WB6_1B_304]
MGKSVTAKPNLGFYSYWTDSGNPSIMTEGGNTSSKGFLEVCSKVGLYSRVFPTIVYTLPDKTQEKQIC